MSSTKKDAFIEKIGFKEIFGNYDEQVAAARRGEKPDEEQKARGKAEYALNILKRGRPEEYLDGLTTKQLRELTDCANKIREAFAKEKGLRI